MSAHAIDVFNIEFWRGEPPALVQNQVTHHTRPGVDGVGMQNVGLWHPPTEAVVEIVYQTFAQADVGYNALRLLPGQGHVHVKWNNIDYQAAYGHRYFVTGVEKVRVKSVVRAQGPTYSYAPATWLVARVQLQPVVI